MKRRYLLGMAVLAVLGVGFVSAFLPWGPITWARGRASAAKDLPARPTPHGGQTGHLTVFTDLGIHGPVVVAFASTHPETIYVGAYEGLARSTDGGQSWQFLGTGISHPRQIVVDPSNPQMLYACRRPLLYERQVAVPGIFKSTDGGFSWQRKDKGISGQEIWSLAIDPNAPHVLYAGGRNGLVFKSTDAGESWSLAGTERPVPFRGSLPREVIGLLVHPVTGALYAVEASAGVFKSEDGGRTWTEVHRSSGFLTVDERTGTLYLASGNLWKSSDGGVSWQDISGNLPRDTRRWSHFLTWVGVNPDPSILYVQQQYQTIYRSTDGGQTWNPLDIKERFVPKKIQPGPYPTLYGVVYGVVKGSLASYVDFSVP